MKAGIKGNAFQKEARHGSADSRRFFQQQHSATLSGQKQRCGHSADSAANNKVIVVWLHRRVIPYEMLVGQAAPVFMGVCISVEEKSHAPESEKRVLQ